MAVRGELEDVVLAARSAGTTAVGGEELAVACLVAAARELPAQACWQLASILVEVVRERSGDQVVSRRAECVAALQVVAERVGAPPSLRQYEEHRRLLAELGVPLPASGFVVRVFGGWLNALRAAGCPPPDRHRRPKDPAVYDPAVPRYTRDELVQALSAFAADLGRAPTVKSYSAWRERRLRVLASNRHRAHLPSQDTLRRAFGSWDGALRAAGLDPASRKTPSAFSDVLGGTRGAVDSGSEA
jgi:hypothetical protein